MKYVKLTVNLGKKINYPIYIGENLLGSSIINQYMSGNKILIISNKKVSSYYMKSLLKSLSSHRYEINILLIPDGEKFKSIKTLHKILITLLKHTFERKTTLIALGGGVIGDIVGFAASIYKRGIEYIQIPTTLLAQVGASIGGKTAINFHGIKNVIGTFHHPTCVIEDVSVLKTLSDRQFKNGFSEVVSYGVIADKSFFNQLIELNYTLIRNDNPLLIMIIERCCRIKASIVQQDEKDQNARMLLNFGHTVGHAIESIKWRRKILHGEAVSIGMLAAAQLSRNLGFLPEKSLLLVQEILLKNKLPTHLPKPISIEKVLKKIKQDKKSSNDQVCFVLLQSIGQAFLRKNISMHSIKEAIQQLN